MVGQLRRASRHGFCWTSPDETRQYQEAYHCHSLCVCICVLGVHLELVADLTTEAFIARLRRFVARRGLPSVIMSDHGTNFVGADRELNKLYTLIKEIRS